MQVITNSTFFIYIKWALEFLCGFSEVADEAKDPNSCSMTQNDSTKNTEYPKWGKLYKIIHRTRFEIYKFQDEFLGIKLSLLCGS